MKSGREIRWPEGGHPICEKNEKIMDMMQSMSEKEKLTIDRTQKIEKYKSKKGIGKRKSPMIVGKELLIPD